MMFLQDSEEYQNLGAELTRSTTILCSICGHPGAAISCCHLGCTVSYHLPCAQEASDVVLNRGAYELWCPDHVLSDSEDEGMLRGAGAGNVLPNRNLHHHGGMGGGGSSPGKRGKGSGNVSRRSVDDDDDFSVHSMRPKRNAGTYLFFLTFFLLLILFYYVAKNILIHSNYPLYSALTRKHRLQRGPSSYSLSSQRHVDLSTSSALLGSGEGSGGNASHRPRTDWQRRGDLWVKAVPPWWCEHRTVHFASECCKYPYYLLCFCCCCCCGYVD